MQLIEHPSIDRALGEPKNGRRKNLRGQNCNICKQDTQNLSIFRQLFKMELLLRNDIFNLGWFKISEV